MNLSSSFLALIFLLFSSNVLVAQANLLNARVPQEVGDLNEKQIAANDESPLEYGFIDDRDVLWSKTIWEKISLDERINFPYYYPTQPQNLGKERRSLFDVLMQGIEEGKIKEVYTDDGGYFREKLTFEGVIEAVTFKGYNKGYEDAIQNALTPEEEAAVEKKYNADTKMKSEDVLEYRIKGTWYFDKRQGEMKYRLLGIAPCTPDKEIKNPQLDKGEITEDELYPLFWVWYPDAREVLNSSFVFNTRNSSQPISYDHMLNSRRFNAIIYKEENIYEDREVNNYIFEDALQQLLESERIKSVIRDFEQDMWNN